ncbi:hypothetical protein FA09DRAFT_332498 [Tilletiopsis washingtonensis]|uniref:Uncharacterized protein n=1 Tax=Tilletiopsis washingtonensis TaxID=58919 RepID=A0A316Z1N5_9BASI|nr:hypothetical protein FA09DRAFT_332498 [Tilletiopsis washingtonensis]PWN94832.1 hypothetical protein FA09DRAFT_332498 [Tilletiopsis washingtonensis]
MPVAFILTPASLAHSALFAGYYSYLNANVISLRRASQTALGSVVKSSNAPARDSEALQRRLVRAVRAQTDFAMSTPIALFFLTISELNGAPTALVHGLATTLLLARVAASQLTLLVPEEHGLNVRENRIVHAWRGGAVTLGNLAALTAAGYNLYLGWDALLAFAGVRT